MSCTAPKVLRIQTKMQKCTYQRIQFIIIRLFWWLEKSKQKPKKEKLQAHNSKSKQYNNKNNGGKV